LKSKVERYREHATDCAKLAASATDDQARAVLMHMAKVWLRLAECHERAADPGEGR
jgi:hypothetical protein